MSVLYPRLIDRVAHQLHDEYTALTVDELRTRAGVHHPSTVFLATGGRHISHDELGALRDELLSLATAAGYPDPAARRFKPEFDTATARLLHERSGLVPAEASARDAWAFLSLVLAPDIAYWRFPAPPAERTIGSDVTRHIFGRLWWRAHLLALPEPTTDRYRLLDTFGEADFDQIFARRRRIGSSRTLVRALARIWAQRDLPGLNEREVLRNSLMRLLRLEAVIDFASLDDDDLDAQVAEAIAITAQALVRHPERRHTTHRRRSSHP
jgi:hypothetical protein